jgi:Flp pilus assembly protein TadG
LKLNERGQTIVEFCIIFPLFLLLIIGMIEFSLILYDQAVITSCSRECARAGIVATAPRTAGTVTTAVNTIVTKYSNKVISMNGTSTLTATPDTSAGTNFGNPLKVTVNYTYTYLVLPNFMTIDGTINLKSTTVMNFE